MTDTPGPRLRTVLYAVDDMSAAVGFYRDALGLPVRVRDGDRYTAIDAGGVTLALTGPGEDVAGGVAAAFQVADVAASVRDLTAAGAVLVHGPEAGPHETRAVLRDPAGNPVVLYAPAKEKP
jgi:predicted enzyme related to lactoylglutathione lyase